MFRVQRKKVCSEFRKAESLHSVLVSDEVCYFTCKKIKMDSE
jgi:hypothetical protein